jgi:hypothetical protein
VTRCPLFTKDNFNKKYEQKQTNQRKIIIIAPIATYLPLSVGLSFQIKTSGKPTIPNAAYPG